MQRLLYAVVVPLLSMAACGQTSEGAPGTPGAPKESLTTMPSHRFGPLPPTTIGVLVAAPHAMLAREGRSAPDDAVCFSTEGRSYMFVYLPVESSGEELEFTVPVDKDNVDKDHGDKGSKTVRFNQIAFLTRPLLAQRKIHEPYALVEVEVNGGQGSASAERFVATKMRVLDASATHPLRVATAVAQVEKSFTNTLRERDKTIAAELEAAKAQYLAGKERTGPRTQEQLAYVSWLSATEHVRITLCQRITDGAFRQAIGVDRVGAAPPGTGQRFGTMFGVEIQAAYEVDKAGRLVVEAVTPVLRLNEELAPPPGVGR